MDSPDAALGCPSAAPGCFGVALGCLGAGQDWNRDGGLAGWLGSAVVEMNHSCVQIQQMKDCAPCCTAAGGDCGCSVCAADWETADGEESGSICCQRSHHCAEASPSGQKSLPCAETVLVNCLCAQQGSANCPCDEMGWQNYACAETGWANFSFAETS